jgi:putative transposase
LQLPSPKSQPIFLSERQQSVLEKIARRQTSSVQLARRVQIILQIGQGKNNQQVATEMGIHRETVRQWRERWLGAAERLSIVEGTADDKQLMELSESVLADELRPGTPAQFNLEQIVEILALACEKPDASGYPLSHWTPQALAAEAVKRRLVERISPRSVGRFLKRCSSTTTPESLLVKCEP